MRKTIIFVLCLAMVFMTTACSEGSPLGKSNDPAVKNWELVKESGRDSVVTLCVDTQDEAALTWLQTEFTAYLKLTYNIELKLIKQSQEKTFESLKSDQQNEIQLGQYDLILFDDTGFKEAVNAGYLFGPFTDELPNSKLYLDPYDIEVRYDEGISIDQYEVPIGRQQLSFIFNENYFYEIPEHYEGFFELVKTFQGKFTYPDPRVSPEGEAFVAGYLSRNLDFEKLNEKAYSEAELYELIKPSLEVLSAIKPDLYKGGTDYPKSVNEMDQLFFSEDLIFSMSLDYYHATDMLKAYEYPEAANVFTIMEGTTGPVAHMGILYNSSNKSGAMLVIDAMLSPEMQASKYDTRKWRQLPIYDPSYVSSEALAEIKKIKLKTTALKHDELLLHRVPELSPYYRALIVKLWEAHVLTNTAEVTP
ncbi:ABC transporter substrate-binding protein [Fusibacter sp. 3D3]|uniref:ABC transporter substrate-binding protein n=1 Tax=Fusibacter sp. 3D3 TaxID=1048380 RepID=UPI000852A0EF|nr:ABC transporter substrate-binding protein [Fusibacter sp. 3D3]GAU78055.1 ABC transporter, periplasmic substrate-binding protein YnjB [Fusibacter sp. 3D3]